ncbi:MAG: sulfatase-like hydrolase/transferase [Deltaproteobacteria bacterium]|nr:sulfatase-like hydrolase/transferase [Deltaproteobacteria bacterium]
MSAARGPGEGADLPFRGRRAPGARLACVLLAAAFAPAACSPPAAPKPRLVILYATCTVNKDFLSPYDADVTFTPYFARFAEDAVVFERHHTEAGMSGIGFASIFSGTQAPTHGVYAHPKRLPDSLTLITEAFKADGYKVFSYARHLMASGKLNYAQGARVGKRPPHLTGSDERFQTILTLLQEDPEFRALIITSFSQTHGPYGKALPKMPAAMRLKLFCRANPDECRDPGYREILEDRKLFHFKAFDLSWNFDAAVEQLRLDDERQARLAASIETLYKMDISRLDRSFGSVLAEIEERGLTDESLIAFTADHGENMHRENAFFSWSHSYQQTPEVVNVPLMIRAPGVAPRRYGAVTRSIDVFPTLAGLSGVAMPEGATVQGEDLSPALRSGRNGDRLLAFSHSGVLPYAVEKGRLPALPLFGSFFPRRDPGLMWVSVRDRDLFYKLRRLDDSGFKSYVFDLAVDPTESTNLFDPEDAGQRAMFERLEAYREQLIAGYETRWIKKDDVSDEEQVRLLRSLGYIE